MPLWLSVLIQVLETVLQAIVSKKAESPEATSDVDHTKDVEKLKSAIAVLKA